MPRQRNLCVKGREEAAESLTVVFNRPATNLAESVIHSHSSAEAEARICESLDKELSEEKTDGAVVSDQVKVTKQARYSSFTDVSIVVYTLKILKSRFLQSCYHYKL